MGQGRTIIDVANNEADVAWMYEIPNDGLIRYKGFFNADRILLTTPETMAEVVATKCYDFEKPKFAATGIGRLLGIGVLLAEGDEHKVQRKNLLPAFSFRHVKDLYPIFWRYGCDMITTICNDIRCQSPLPAHPEATKSHIPPSKTIEIASWVSRATLDIIGSAGLGFEFNSLHDDQSPLNVTYRKVFEPTRGAMILGIANMYLPPWLVRRIPIKRNGEMDAASRVIRETCYQVIQNKKQKLAADSKDTGKDILSVAMDSGYFSDSNLVDQLMTFLAAGHETTATAMTWAAYHLAKNPEIQARLRSEVRDALPSPDNDGAVITDKDIDALPYLHAVVMEVLRLNPPVPRTVRVPNKDTTIGGHFIPKGTRIILAPWGFSRLKSLWGEDAREFRPERWLGEGRANNGGAKRNYAFMTFLHGPRSCIGASFAKAEFKILLALLAGRLEWVLDDPEYKVNIQGTITAKIEGGLDIKAKIVEGW